MIFLLIALGYGAPDYQDGFTDGYCQSIADRGHGWSIDEVPHSEAGFTCVWSVPLAEGHVEYCSDVGGEALRQDNRMFCSLLVAW